VRVGDDNEAAAALRAAVDLEPDDAEDVFTALEFTRDTARRADDAVFIEEWDFVLIDVK
jgi:hypothetical protein